MAEIIDLERFRSKVAADQGFRSWLARFQEQFGPDTRLQDLSQSTLLYLATPGEENLFVFFDLVMGAQGLGGSVRFRLDDLDNDIKMKIRWAESIRSGRFSEFATSCWLRSRSALPRPSS